MRTPTQMSALLFVSLSWCFGAAAQAAPTFGWCDVTVTGATSISFHQEAFNPGEPHEQNTSGTNLLWTKASSSPFAAMMVNDPQGLFAVDCKNAKGLLVLRAGPKTTAAEFKSGPGKYRIIGRGNASNEAKPGDVTGDFMNGANLFDMVSPKSTAPGELVITRNDKDKLEGTFTFTDGKRTVTGKFSLTPAPN
jgi:hypothetical protein